MHKESAMEHAMEHQVSMGPQVRWAESKPWPQGTGPKAVGSRLGRDLARAEVLAGAEPGGTWGFGAVGVPRAWKPGELSASIARGRAAMLVAVEGLRVKDEAADAAHAVVRQAKAAEAKAKALRKATEEMLRVMREGGDLAEVMGRLAALAG